MPTENPKISAYVPKIIYDRFKQFQEERGLSMSQAAIELISEYFGIGLTNNSTREFSGGLSDRVTQLEQLIFDLKQSYVYLSNRVDSIQSTSNLLNTNNQSKLPSSLPDNSVFGSLVNLPNLPESGLYSNSINLTSLPRIDISTSSVNLIDMSTSSLLSSLDSKLLSNSESKPPIIKSLQESTTSELNSSLDVKPHKQLHLIESKENFISELLNEFKSNPLQGKLLAARLRITNSKLSTAKNSLSVEDFYSWIREKDFDNIKWVSLGKGRSKGYIPADDTPLEKLQALQEWILSYR